MSYLLVSRDVSGAAIRSKWLNREVATFTTDGPFGRVADGTDWGAVQDWVSSGSGFGGLGRDPLGVRAFDLSPGPGDAAWLLDLLIADLHDRWVADDGWRMFDRVGEPAGVRAAEVLGHARVDAASVDLEVMLKDVDWGRVKNLELSIDQVGVSRTVHIENFVDVRMRLGAMGDGAVAAGPGASVRIDNLKRGEVDASHLDGGLRLDLTVWSNAGARDTIAITGSAFGDAITVDAGTRFRPAEGDRGSFYDGPHGKRDWQDNAGGEISPWWTDGPEWRDAEFVRAEGSHPTASQADELIGMLGRPGVYWNYDGSLTSIIAEMGFGNDSFIAARDEQIYGYDFRQRMYAMISNSNSDADPRPFQSTDTVWGQSGDDTIHTGGGNDVLFGDFGGTAGFRTPGLTNTIRTTRWDPAATIIDDEVERTLTSASGNDTLVGGSGADILMGGRDRGRISLSTDATSVTFTIGDRITGGTGEGYGAEPWFPISHPPRDDGSSDRAFHRRGDGVDLIGDLIRIEAQGFDATQRAAARLLTSGPMIEVGGGEGEDESGVHIVPPDLIPAYSVVYFSKNNGLIFDNRAYYYGRGELPDAVSDLVTWV